MADKKISELTAAAAPLAGTEVLPIVQGGSTVKVSVDNLTTGKAVSTGNLTVTGTLTGSTGIMNIGSGQVYKDAQGNVSIGTATPEGILTVKGGASPNARQIIVGYGSTSQNYYDATTHTWRTGFFGTSMELNSTSLTLTSRDLVIGTAGKGIDFSANTNAAGMTSELLNWYEEGTWTPVLRDSVGTTMTLTTAAGNYRRIGSLVHIRFYVKSSDDLTDTAYSILQGMPFSAVTTDPIYIGSAYTPQTTVSRGSTHGIQIANATQFYLFIAQVSGSANTFAYADEIWGFATYTA